MANQKIIAQKAEVVSEIKAKLEGSSCTVLADYRGLNVKQVTELRSELRKAGVEMKVLKNTLTRRATAQANLTALDQYLTGPTAIIFGKDDVIAPAKIMMEYSKKFDKLNVKGGVVEGRVVDEAQIKALAELPNREGMLSMLLSVLQAPIRNFALAVKAVSEQKEGSAS